MRRDAILDRFACRQDACHDDSDVPEVDLTLGFLVDQVEVGDIGLPDIQRPLIWPKTKVRDLFDSMYRGFPVGYLLFWATLATAPGAGSSVTIRSSGSPTS